MKKSPNIVQVEKKKDVRDYNKTKIFCRNALKKIISLKKLININNKEKLTLLYRKINGRRFG